MAESAIVGFAGLLRQLRAEARLTQEQLAEAARLSPRSVSDLERGINRTAQKNTALLLADALGLGGQARDLFVAAARGKAPAGDVLAARQGEPPADDRLSASPHMPYDAPRRGPPVSADLFVGRDGELAAVSRMLTGAGTRLVTLTGPPGIGKTRLAVACAAAYAAQ